MAVWKCFVFICFPLVIEGDIFKKREPSLFEDPGLVMMENVDGVTYLKHIFLNGADMWVKIQDQQPVTKARAEKNKHNLTHIDVDYHSRTFVMSDANSKSIMALKFDELGMFKWFPVYQGTSAKVNGIAIDWTTDVVYWTDEVYDTIFAASLIIHNAAAPIIDEDLKNPYGIVVHPRQGYMFWTEASSRRYLRRATLGGRKKKTLHFFLDVVAYALHLDHEKDRLYYVFTRYSESGIKSCNLDGRQHETLKSNKQRDFFIFDIDLYKDQFVSMEQTGDTTRMVMYNGHRIRTTGNIVMNGTASGLIVMDPFRQFYTTNPCELSSCPGVCTRSIVTEDCFCIGDLKAQLDPNVARIYCGVEWYSGLLVNKGGGIFSMPTNFAELAASSPYLYAEPRRVVASPSIINVMVSDVRRNKLFFYERQQGVIKSVRMSADEEPEVVSMAALDIGGLAFDTLGENLYWTDKTKEHIMVSGTNGEFPVVLHKGLNNPHAIALHPDRAHRLLFWSEKPHFVSIMRSSLDGTDKETILHSLDLTVRLVNDIAVDIDKDRPRLYFCGDEKIYTSHLDGANFHELYDQPRRKFTGITIMHDYLVLSDTYYKSSGLHAFLKPKLEQEKDPYMNLTLVGKAVYPIYDHGNWYGVTYHHHSNIPLSERTSSCRMSSNKCDQVCLEGHRRSKRCLCTLGYETDGNNCTLAPPYRPYLLVADQRYRKLLHIRHRPRTYVDIPVKALKQPFSISYDPGVRNKLNEDEEVDQVYWSDLETGSILRSNMDGSQQEVVVYDPRSFITCMELDPNSRLLYYVSRPRYEYPYYSIASSLVVLDVDTGRKKNITWALDYPISIAVSEQHGYVYLVEQNNIWRVSMGGYLERLSNNVEAQAITIVDNYLYFVNVSRGRSYIDPVTVQLLRVDISDDNVTTLSDDMFDDNATLLVELPGNVIVQDLVADENYVYWTNSQKRNIQYVPLQGPYNVTDVTDVTVDDQLFQPSGIATIKIPSLYERNVRGSKCYNCRGMCLINPGDEVICDVNATISELETDDTELCRIPEITHGEVEGNDVDRIVPDGYYASVRCFPLHRISDKKPFVCNNGSWSHIPHCILDYTICGDIQKGYKVYKQSGQYFVYPEMTRVRVILIGGGGGGYDVMNSNITANGHAGNGGNSSFKDFIVTGGKGGTATKGGKGGKGHSPGGDGSDPGGCTTGGTAGQRSPPKSPDRPGESADLFAGAGGYSDSCTKAHIDQYIGTFAGPGGSFSGYYGGGAGGREGGAGGGGGWASKTFSAMPPKTVVPVTVGAAGTPSYSPPGPGLVVVTWGDFVINTYVGKKFDVLNTCVFD